MDYLVTEVMVNGADDLPDSSVRTARLQDVYAGEDGQGHDAFRSTPSSYSPNMRVTRSINRSSSLNWLG